MVQPRCIGMSKLRMHHDSGSTRPLVGLRDDLFSSFEVGYGKARGRQHSRGTGSKRVYQNQILTFARTR